MKALKWMPLALSLVASPLLATTPIEQSRDLAADASVTVRNVAGAVHVSVWNHDRIHITGSLGDGARGLDIHGDRHALSISVQGPKSSGWFSWGDSGQMGPTVLNIQVPRAVSMTVKTVSASIDLSGLQGGAQALTSVSGRIHVQADGPVLDADSVSGSIDVDGHFERARLVTVSGDMLAPKLGSNLHLQTVSGHLRAGGGPFQDAQVSTVSGDVELHGGVDPHGAIRIESMSGDVRLRLPPGQPLQIHASTFSGDIHSDLGHVHTRERGPGSTLDTGDHGGTIHVETFSGDLRIRGG